LVLAVLGTVAMAALGAALLEAIGATQRNVAVAVAGILVMSLVWMPVTRRWSAAGHLCWSMTILLFTSYLVFMLQWTFASHLGAAGTAGGLLLWSLELAAAMLGCAYVWEMCDALGRESWRRRIANGASVPPNAPLPFVSLQVPAYNEPPEMVIETLRSLQALDYENYEIIAIDDNSDDESLWRPLEAWCSDNGVKFVHLQDWPGYKSGALNYALEHMIDPRTELIGVIDADYQVDSAFLRRCAPLFLESKVGFIQAPQDYRDWEHAPFYRRLYYSYRYFFSVTQPSRNERDGAIFAGTMGLIRRDALEAVGGWDEWCITEDAELSLRLLRSGWSGLHVDQSFGKGIMPLTFEALKGQRFRWCFGGIQILRRHWRSMLPGRRTPDNQLDLGQRWAYLSGAIQWYGDLLALVFFVFLVIGAVNIGLGSGLLFRKLSGFLLAAIPFLVALGLTRAIALVRRGTGASWRDAFGSFMIWQATALVVARASVQGLFAKEAEFLRTPKTSEESSWWDAVRGNLGETALAALGVAGIAAGLTKAASFGGPLTAGLLIWPTLAFASAPYNSLAARRATLPPRLRARRDTEYLRSGATKRVTVAAAGLATAGAMAAGIVGLMAPGSAPVILPPLVGPARGQPVQYHASRGPAGSPVPTTASPSSLKPGAPTVSTTVNLNSPTSTTPSATPTSRPPGPPSTLVTTTSVTPPTSTTSSTAPPSSSPSTTTVITPPTTMPARHS
jgi:cellulose synthase/poly-beta-1,6-N-acetylglucosamine synthase-like glycosyltransferase